MEIAILGGGHGCFAAAIDLTERGHEVRWWRRNAEAHKAAMERGGLEVIDAKGTREVKIAHFTTDLAATVKGVRYILMPLPADTQVDLFAQVAPHLEDGQVVFMPPGTFGSYLLQKALKDCGNAAQIATAETGTLPYLARKQGPTTVRISGYGTRLPTGVFPRKAADWAFPLLKDAYPAVEDCGDALSGALMNAGPIIHPPLILMNAGPLQHFERWDIHNEGTQPSIRATTDALDHERIAVREALGYGAPHFPLADHYDDEREEWMYGNAAHEKLTDSGDWREDIDLHSHRYMTEDVAIGLVLIASVGRFAGVPTPIASGMVAISEAITGRPLYAQGRTLENLGLADLGRDGLKKLLDEGL